jgi:hypothetical protein
MIRCTQSKHAQSEEYRPLVGEPLWLSWEYDQFSTPQSFDGDVSSFAQLVDWVLSAPHILYTGLGSHGYDAILTWTLVAGLLYRDLTELDRLRADYPEAMDRMLVWGGQRSADFAIVLEKTCQVLDWEKILINRVVTSSQVMATDVPSPTATPGDEAGPSQLLKSDTLSKPIPKSKPTLKPKPTKLKFNMVWHDDRPVLMSEADLLQGIITPPLYNTPPSTATSRSSYLKGLSIFPSLIELQQALDLYAVSL